MIKRGCLFFSILVLFVTVSFFNVQAFTYTNSEGDEVEADYGSSDFYSDIDYDNEQIDWNEFDQSKVPSDRIHEIPDDKVDPTKVQDKSKLTSQQLAYIDANGKANIDKVNANDLSKTARDEALKILGRTDEDIETETDTQPSKITTYDDGFEIDWISSISIGDLNIIKGNGFSYRNGIVKVEKADTIKIKDGILADVENFTGNEIEFSVGEVKTVINEGVTINNVLDSDFKITDDDIEIISNEGTTFDILDSSFAETTFTANENGKITITKDIPTDYTIQNGSLIFNSTSFSETITANNSVMATLDPIYGFSCMTITPPGTYFYNDENILKDFAVHVPVNGSEYKLCIRKDTIQHFTDYDGIVDFPDNLINLNKIVTYLRYPFENGILTDLIMKPVYGGKDIGNNATMKLDDEFIFINEMFLSNDMAFNRPIALMHAGYHTIIEKTENSRNKRYELIENSFYPDVIDYYKHESINNPVWIMKQNNVSNTLLQKNLVLESSVTIYPPTDITKERFLTVLDRSYRDYDLK